MVTMLSTSFGPYNVGHMSNLGHVDIVDDHLHEDKTSNQYAVVESDRTYPLAYIFGNFISLHHSSINPNHFLKLATFYKMMMRKYSSGKDTFLFLIWTFSMKHLMRPSSLF